MTKQAGNLWLREVKSTNEPVHSGITALQENAQETLFDPADGLVLSFRFRFGAGVHLGHGLLQGLPSDPACRLALSANPIDVEIDRQIIETS